MPVAERFRGIIAFEQCMAGARMTPDGFDTDGDLVVDAPNDPMAVAAVQQALADLGYDIAASGIYDGDTTATVRQFKVDQELAVPAGMVTHDGVTGRGTSNRLNVLFSAEPLPPPPPPPPEDDQVRYTDRKSHYTNVALAKANSPAHGEWLPELGYLANRPQIVDVYRYYRDLYLAQPELFLWAGLGHMAGGAVIGGLDHDPVGFIDQVIMVRIGKDIFFDLAWQHEAFLDRPDSVVELAALHDRFNTYPHYDTAGVVTYRPGTPRRSYRQAWERIVSGDPSQIALGNQDLLENEQFSIIQPQYDFLRTILFSGLPTPFTNNVHPYHRAFVVEQPGGDILKADSRWAWISGLMYQNWVASGSAERSRLVSHPFDRICIGDFGIPGRPDLLPPGGP